MTDVATEVVEDTAEVDAAMGETPDLAAADTPVEPPPAEPPMVSDRFERVVTSLIVAACSAFVFWQLQPDLILSDTTPTGGDMGAHVWGPAFLRDELLPRLQLSGWTPDWYAGFPAFHFYMVLPALAIVILDIGLHPILSASILVALTAAAFLFRDRGDHVMARRLLIGALVLAPFIIGLPYNIAFKLVAVSGVVFFPVGAWALGHLGGLRFPGPAVLSVASLAFAFDRSFNIYGGNIASTLAGEFAASISLTLSLVALGFVIRGTRTGQHKGWAGVFIALTGLCHLLPAFFLLAATFIVMVFRVVAGRFNAVPWLAVAGTLSALLSAFWVLPFFVRTSYLNDMGWERIEIIHSPLVTRSILNPSEVLSDYPPLPVLLILGVIGLVLSVIRRVELGWFLALTAALMAFGFVFFPDGRLWNARILPFYYLSVGLLAGIGVALLIRELVATGWIMRGALFLSSVVLLASSQIRGANVWPEPTRWQDYLADATGYTLRVLAIFMIVATVGMSLAVVLSQVVPRWITVGAITALALLLASPARDVVSRELEMPALLVWAAVFAGSIAMVLLALAWPYLNQRHENRMAIAEALDHHHHGDDHDHDDHEIPPPTPWWSPIEPSAAYAGGAVVAATTVFILLGLALNSVGGISEPQPGRYAWGVAGQEFSSADTSFVTGWATWNFSGMQAKGIDRNGRGDVGQGGWEEYQYVNRTMAGVGNELGCGRAMWEFAPELNRYGTTMAMMLMPMWTDGCIGSMEGLYFEATPTVPYHFLVQSDLSAGARQIGDAGSVGGPSRAMRDLPYLDFNIERGVDRLYEMGVRYYMAFSPTSIEAARANPRLTEVAAASPWVVFETEANLVEPLDVAPVVIDGVRDHQDEWLDVGVEWFTSNGVVRPASSGPAEWRRVDREVVERYEAEDTRLAGSIAPDAAPMGELLPQVDITQDVVVSNVRTDTDQISFTVDQVGTPVLVRASYFPNWTVSGADGPYRVAPNFMVVVPTDTDVELNYRRGLVDWVAIVLTIGGLVLLAAIARRKLPSMLQVETP